jgi:hypothetical protein
MKKNNLTIPYPTKHTPHAILEIARLENSLQHLRRTQDELRLYSDDPELSQYLGENEEVMFVCPPSLPLCSSSDPFILKQIDPTVIVLGLVCSASQAERVDMLNIALNEKGVVASGSHYEPTKTPAAASASRQPPAHPLDAVIDESNDAIDGGVML